MAALLWCVPSSGSAYSAFADYVLPIQEGGGGERYFTGTPADGYGCEVCHQGAVGAPLTIAGLPIDGYEPGATYEVSLVWDASAPHVALMAELTDAAGGPVGTLGLAPYATWSPGELCESGDFPAADVCQLTPGDAACCREIDPNLDACSFTGQRAALWVPDCGSRSARMRWTAPADGSADIWFSVAMVTSDLENDALGDGVTTVRRFLRPRRSPRELSTAVSGCSAVPGSAGGALPLLGLLLWWVVLQALRPRSEWRGHTER
ncbi:MAG: hypothetical protein OXT09_03135 [Myxococcales bacterium]|nr:hypothetical protein [Myxococcales bacterium]